MFSRKPYLVDADNALPGHDQPLFTVPERHEVLGTALVGPWPTDVEVIYLAMGCFWGAEEYFWQLPGVYSTAVGYMGGFSPNPTYEEVCTGRTGHTETALVAYRPAQVSTVDILKVFWEHHDPTQGNRQGNDIGTQYRGAIFWTTPEQEAAAIATRDAFQEVLTEHHLGAITTQIESAAGHTFYYAEDYHQQYLHKIPHGYRCHATTGMVMPDVSVG